MFNTKLELDVEFEETWETLTRAATIIPMNSKWKAIGVQVSGGLDSAILLYLTVKTIQKHNLDVKIVPISFEIYNKAKTLSSARAVIDKVESLTGFTNWGERVEVVGNEAQAEFEGKAELFTSVITDLFKRGITQFEINGVTRNPPIDVCKHFKSNDYREFVRDDPSSIYNGKENASPHAFVDKQGIVEHYIIHGVLDELAPLTLSCDEKLSEIVAHNWPVPCGTCWWCSERRWGFESNGLNYNKYSPINAHPK